MNAIPYEGNFEAKWIVARPEGWSNNHPESVLDLAADAAPFRIAEAGILNHKLGYDSKSNLYLEISETFKQFTYTHLCLIFIMGSAFDIFTKVLSGNAELKPTVVSLCLLSFILLLHAAPNWFAFQLSKLFPGKEK